MASAPSSLEGWLSRYRGYVATGKANAGRFAAELAAEKAKKRPNSARIKFFEQSLKKVNSEVAHWQSEIAATQNKIYMREGQYEKLLTGQDRDAYMAINALFKSYGLETLAPKIFDYVKNGYSADTISILLQDTPEYKTRFAGNEARIKAGLPVLTAGEYLATEASYRQIMQSAGMPIGFYDQSSDFVGWIAKNVSPSEIQSRVDLATQATVLAPASYREALKQMGISQSEMAAYFLSPEKALPFLQKSAATAAIGAEALQQGLKFDQTYAEQLAMQGITAAEAQQGYQQVAGELGTMKALGAQYGGGWTQRESEQAALEGLASATEKKGRLLSRERGAFAGATGGARAGLGGRGGAK